MSMSGFAGGAAQGLQQVDETQLQRVLYELRLKQLQQEAQQFDRSASQADQRIGVDRGHLDLRQREFDLASQPKPQAPTPPRVVGGRLVRDDGTVVYEPPAPTPQPQRPMVVSGHLVDPSGKVLFRAPKDTPASAGPPEDDPSLPRGVQDYLVQLRAKYNSFDEAAGELSRAAGDLRSAHPSLDSVKTLNALRAQYVGSANPKTPEEIAAESAARARGTAEGKSGAEQPSRIERMIRGFFTKDGPQQNGGMVKMRAPDGGELMVPASDVSALEAQGAVRVQ